MNAIIFVGKAGSGKDTAAGAVLEQVSQLQTFKWADSLKDVACMVYGWDRALIDTDNDYKEEKPLAYSLNGDGTTCARFQCPGADGQGLTRRQVLQLLGTECFRQTIADDTWLQSAWRRIQEIEEFSRHHDPDLPPLAHNYPIHGWVNTDTRFPNEVEFARLCFDRCLVIKIERLGTGTLTEATSHASEALIDTLDVDVVIQAKDGDLAGLRQQAVEAAALFFVGA